MIRPLNDQEMADARIRAAHEANKWQYDVWVRLLATYDALATDYGALVRHHRECELIGTELAQMVEDEVRGYGSRWPVNDDDLMAVVVKWNAHQWPALLQGSHPKRPGEDVVALHD